MKTVLGIAARTCLAVGSILFTLQAMRGEARAGGGEKLLEFKQLVGVSGVFLQPPSNQNPQPLRSVLGGGVPWVIDKGEARLKENGELKVEVEGLVLDPNDPIVQRLGLGGINPVAQFFATLSCLDTAGNVINIDTAPVAASLEGDAKVKEVLDLPETCIAPIILVRGVSAPFQNPWFAASGF